MQIQYPQGKQTFNSKKGGKKTPVKNRSITFFTMNTTTTFSTPGFYEELLEYYRYPTSAEQDINSLYFKKDVNLDNPEKTSD